jgi:hypothetical protein
VASAAFQALFVSYKYSPQAVLPPDDVRKCLSYLYMGRERFKLGAMDDATEALEAVLTLHHREQVCNL